MVGVRIEEREKPKNNGAQSVRSEKYLLRKSEM